MAICEREENMELLFGTIHWAGSFRDKPAFALKWYGGAALWVYDGKWNRVKVGSYLNDVVPRMCPTCNTLLPVVNE